ncbi:nicotinate-nucleotide--dimethylbenzimidazole phosphoribosyltransferase [Paenibacillus sp. NEAU-GSW1]|nr:nicotinate-nucleotide--dimethylbenzimidazole phosphoribosyltransferase [Paenibacillus sp. NEAU-GSW1]
MIENKIKQIRKFDETASARAQRHSDNLTKPPGSLGKLESIAAQLAGIHGDLWPQLDKRAVVVMAADHGVCDEGVSAFPQEVTAQMVLNFLSGGAAVNVLAAQAGADVFCVDIGVKTDVDHPDVCSRKVVYGTANMVKGAAMSLDQTKQAIAAGIAVAEELVGKGYRLFATGEMGIGNTTASAAIASVLLGLPPEQTVGRGTGIDDSGWLRKVEIVKRAIEVNAPAADQPVETLAKVGGAEIAGLAGVIIGAAANGCPVVVDGYISSVAALVAAKISDRVKPYLFGSHLSQEQGHKRVLEALELEPMVQLDMRLGEGTGAVLCFHFLDAALKLMQEMATFESAGISKE